ncbi:MAG: acyloxyacyl hydrolase [Pseudomonas sp.]|nr:acyloxyacyl hydrolase [Pseudomonas sp.]
MKKCSLLVGSALLSVMAMQPAFAERGLTLEVGQTSDSDKVYRLGMQFDFGRSLWQSDGGNVRLEGYWDAGLTRWQADSATSVSVMPVFQFRFGQGATVPFVEAGIGAAWFSKTELEESERDLGSAFQFEDMIGAGLRFDSGSQAGIRAYHYSNAGIKEPNQGINKVALYYRLAI